jgi:hypothetical protein
MKVRKGTPFKFTATFGRLETLELEGIVSSVVFRRLLRQF